MSFRLDSGEVAAIRARERASAAADRERHARGSIVRRGLLTTASLAFGAGAAFAGAEHVYASASTLPHTTDLASQPIHTSGTTVSTEHTSTLSHASNTVPTDDPRQLGVDGADRRGPWSFDGITTVDRSAEEINARDNVASWLNGTYAPHPTGYSTDASGSIIPSGETNPTVPGAKVWFIHNAVYLGYAYNEKGVREDLWGMYDKNGSGNPVVLVDQQVSADDLSSLSKHHLTPADLQLGLGVNGGDTSSGHVVPVYPYPYPHTDNPTDSYIQIGRVADLEIDGVASPKQYPWMTKGEWNFLDGPGAAHAVVSTNAAEAIQSNASLPVSTPANNLPFIVGAIPSDPNYIQYNAQFDIDRTPGIPVVGLEVNS